MKYIYTYMSCYIWRKNIYCIYIVDEGNDAIFVYLAERVPSYKRRKMAKCIRIIVRTERPSELKNVIAKNIVGNRINEQLIVQLQINNKTFVQLKDYLNAIMLIGIKNNYRLRICP